MDHAEEQAGEMEALQSIYEGELEVVATEPYCVFTMPVKTEDYDEDAGTGVYVKVKVGYTPKYPEEAPTLDLEDAVNLDENGMREELLAHLDEQIQESLGTVMGFNIFSAALEWICNQWEEIKAKKDEEDKRRKELEEEEEKKRLEGTKVTIESFLAWKATFDAERLKNVKVVDPSERRMTGKEMFLNNASLNDSDIKFGGEGAEDAVEVDESLFEEMDDLDLLDDDDDDEDYDPRLDRDVP